MTFNTTARGMVYLGRKTNTYAPAFGLPPQFEHMLRGIKVYLSLWELIPLKPIRKWAWHTEPCPGPSWKAGLVLKLQTIPCKNVDREAFWQMYKCTLYVHGTNTMFQVKFKSIHVTSGQLTKLFKIPKTAVDASIYSKTPFRERLWDQAKCSLYRLRCSLIGGACGCSPVLAFAGEFHKHNK